MRRHEFDDDKDITSIATGNRADVGRASCRGRILGSVRLEEVIVKEDFSLPLLTSLQQYNTWNDVEG